MSIPNKVYLHINGQNIVDFSKGLISYSHTEKNTVTEIGFTYVAGKETMSRTKGEFHISDKHGGKDILMRLTILARPDRPCVNVDVAVDVECRR